MDSQKFYFLLWVAIRRAKSKPTTGNATDRDPRQPSIVIENVKSPTPSEMLDAYLKSVHIWLENQKDRKLMAAYRKASSKTLHDAEEALQVMPRSELDELTDGTTAKRFFEDGKSIFSLFIPLKQQGPMCSKVWGSLYVRSSALIKYLSMTNNIIVRQWPL
jgi:hypothetical protein